MTVFMYDGASLPDLAKVRAAGGSAVCIYLTGRYAAPDSYISAALAQGLGVVPAYEQAPDELVHAGRAGGQDIGRRILAALTVRGFPANNTIGVPCAVDVRVAPALFPQVGDGFDGVNDILRGRFLTKCYGEGALLDYLVSTGRVFGRQWLSASSSYDGYNPADPNVDLVQRIGSPVPGTDQDEITYDDLAAWWPPGHHASAAQSGTTTLEDDEMKFRLIKDKADTSGAIYAYNNAGMWWHVPNPDWESELLADPDCLSTVADIAQDTEKVDALKAMADSSVNGPIGQIDQVLQLLADPSNGVLVKLAELVARPIPAAGPTGPAIPPKPLTITLTGSAE